MASHRINRLETGPPHPPVWSLPLCITPKEQPRSVERLIDALVLKARGMAFHQWHYQSCADTMWCDCLKNVTSQQDLPRDFESTESWGTREITTFYGLLLRYSSFFFSPASSLSTSLQELFITPSVKVGLTTKDFPPLLSRLTPGWSLVFSHRLWLIKLASAALSFEGNTAELGMKSSWWINLRREWLGVSLLQKYTSLTSCSTQGASSS